MNSRHNLLLQIAVITLLSRLPWVASQVWWVRADPPWNLKIYKIPRKIFLIVRRVRKFIFKISHKWDKLPPWSCWNLFQKHELKWMGWWEHKTLRYALKIMKTKFIFFMFSSSHSCMWPSVSCSHAPNNWIKLWSAARLQTITMSACAIYRHAPPGVTHEQWHQWSGSRPHFQFILLQIWVGREPHLPPGHRPGQPPPTPHSQRLAWATSHFREWHSLKETQRRGPGETTVPVQWS